jgi:hypothetical protein
MSDQQVDELISWIFDGDVPAERAERAIGRSIIPELRRGQDRACSP